MKIKTLHKMKSSILLITANLLCLAIFAQKLNIKTSFEAIPSGYILYADNNEPCPVSLRLTLKMKNLKSSEKNGKIYLIPANTKKFKLTELKSIRKGKYTFSSSTRYNLGDHFQRTYDKEYAYSLPFDSGKEVKIIQSYNGTFSHQNQNALDFDLKQGSNVLAVRDGIVTKVVEHNTKSCPTEKCKEFGNYVKVYHEDGTFAEYVHMSKNGVLVDKGDQIKEGQIIAKSGNTGWSDGPHLHFEIYTQDINGKKKTLKTKFKIGNGEKIEYLLEKKIYKKDY